jgi:hypothetical protein
LVEHACGDVASAAQSLQFARTLATDPAAEARVAAATVRISRPV